jgi:hypothetical protein
VILAILAALVGSSTVAHATPLAGAENCPVFPRSSPWNQRVDRLPVLRRSKQIVSSMGRRKRAHAHFGSGRWQGTTIGHPYKVVDSSTPRVPVSFEFTNSSDPGPYPIPPDAPVEAASRPGSDRHVILVDRSACKLYELYSAFPHSGGSSWTAGSGAIWDMRANQQRAAGRGSADAAGLPILAGLARPEELQRGRIDHALRITAPRTRKGWVYPASHDATNLTSRKLPQMGQRLRIKRRFSIRRFPRQSRIVLRALQRYGAIVADHGLPWQIGGVPSERWNNGDLHKLEKVPGSAWEVVDSTRLRRHRG